MSCILIECLYKVYDIKKSCLSIKKRQKQLRLKKSSSANPPGLNPK